MGFFFGTHSNKVIMGTRNSARIVKARLALPGYKPTSPPPPPPKFRFLLGHFVFCCVILCFVLNIYLLISGISICVSLDELLIYVHIICKGGYFLSLYLYHKTEFLRTRNITQNYFLSTTFISF